MNNTAWRLAVVGAGPVGLALALHAARVLPAASITVFDARPAERDVAGDPRALALALGSVMFLERVGAWPRQRAEPILEVRVSQAPPSFRGLAGEPEVVLRAAELGVAQLGAVLSYGELVAPLQRAWQGEVAGQPARLALRLGTPVAALKPVPGGVEVDAGVAETCDLAVVAEGGVFAEQARKAIAHDYGQTAWVGSAMVEGGARGVAFERFTRHGPLALLPLPPAAGGARRAALVWCVASADDPVRDLDAAQRLVVLNALLPPGAGRLVSLSPLKDFALGLNAERTLVGAGPNGGAGRIVRIGNAAQTLHPVAGQGLNLGLRDAYALVAALRSGNDIDAALRRVEWSRAGDRWSTIATTDFLARSFTWQLPGLAALRGLGLAALQATPRLKAALARGMMFGLR
jgi:2-octaprenyl-6-methoxyphenol hydroxylase